MAIAATMTKNAAGGDHEIGQKFERVYGTLVFSGNYNTGARDAINFSTLSGGVAGMGVKSNKIPVNVFIQGVNGYSYGYIPGTTRDNGTVKISTGGAAELTGAPTAYPAGVTGDTITFEAIFCKV